MTSFGPFNLSAGGLSRDGKPIALGQRAVALLAALVLVDGPVPKAALMDAAWPGTIVEEGNLTVQIAALRKALGARPDGQEWIVTVPRVGYRLLRGAPDEVAESSGPPALAVLPFQNLGGDPEQDYFADGIVEDIITALSRFKSFQTIARHSSFVYRGGAIDVREVGRALGAAYVVEGSVRRSAQRLRVTAQLIDGASGSHLWTQSFDGSVEDVFDVQERITESVAALIEPKIQQAELMRSRRERRGGAAAYDLYLRAREKVEISLAQPNFDGLQLLEQVLVLAPDYAPALALMAHALEQRVTQDWPAHRPDDAERCVQLAWQAIRLAPDDASILARCAMPLINVGGDAANGLVLLERAIAANPNDALAVHHAGIANVFAGDLDKAEEYFHRVIRLNLTSSADIAMTGLAHVSLLRHQPEAALAWATKASAINLGFNPALWMLVAANVQLGRMDEARRRLAAHLELVPEARLRGVFGGGLAARYSERLSPIVDALREAGMPDG